MEDIAINETEEPVGSRLFRMKNSIERGRLVRPPYNMDIHQLRKPSSFFKSLSHHKRRGSLAGLVESTEGIQLTASRSTSPHSININASPKMKSFSPTKSFESFHEERAEQNQSSTMQPPIRFDVPDDPRVTVTSGAEPSGKSSTLSRLTRRTFSRFFDQMNSNPPVAPNQSESTIESTQERPRLSKALSDSKQQVILNEIHHEPCSAVPQNDAIRKRSRTLGSIENDMYSKRNGSIAKTIGSMVMMKPRQCTSESQPNSDSDDALVSIRIPEVEEEDSEDVYLQKLLEEGLEAEAPSILSERRDDFLIGCLLRFFEDRFDFREEPLDVSLRKFLARCELPKETQQIDRVLSAFSSRYYDCNVELWDDPDQIYVLTFSLVMLHTDYFNNNNRKKMTKEEFVKNTNFDDPSQSTSATFITKELLEYFYDNITCAKFIQRTRPRSLHQQTLYSLPRRIFSSASSTNLDVANVSTNTSQVLPVNTRSLSLSSSTSQFFSSNHIDPYSYIIDDQIDILRLTFAKVQDENPFSNELRYEPLESYYVQIRERIIKRGGIYIRFYKNIGWITGKTEVKVVHDEMLNIDEVSKIDDSKNLIKIIKIAELYREETVKNNKFFTIGSTSRVIWKKCFGILTTCGLFIFDNLNFLAISDRERILDEENLHSPEATFIDINSEQILKACSKLAINGLFACQADLSSEGNHSFNLYSTNKKELFSTTTFSEMSSWILAINYIAAVDSCYLDDIEYENNEVVSLRSISTDDKIQKLTKILPELNKKIGDITRIQHHVSNLTPFQSKTREALTNYYKSLEVKIDWLWYQVGRNEVYVHILEKELPKDRYSTKVETDTESFLGGSFINEENLHSQDGGINLMRLIRAQKESQSVFSSPISHAYSSDDERADDTGEQFFDALNDNL